MAECYCGCVRKLGALASGRKSANRMGRLITETLASIERDVRPAPGVSPEVAKVGPFAERVAQTKKEGETFEQDCRSVVHEEMAYGDASWPAMRQWVRNAQGMTSFFRLPPEQQRRVMESG